MHGARRLADVQAPIIPIVGQWIRRHPGTISLGQGVVHYGPPPQAIEAVGRFLSDPENHKYKLVDGIAELQSAIENKLLKENRITLGEESRLVVTAGGNMAFFHAMMAVADPGDEVILLAPYYFNQEMALAMLNCRAVLVPTDQEYRLELASIERAITPRTRAVVTISPNNPTGTVYSRESLTAVNELCRRRGLYHVSDEAYEYFTFEDEVHFSPGSLPGSGKHTISLFSLSKAYGFASWRIGYMALPEELLTGIKKAQDTILICPPVISQFAACGALAAGEAFWRPKVEALAKVRRMVLEELECLKPFCEIPPARGAFYFLLRVDVPMDPMELTERLIREHGVAVIPGTAFGLEKGCSLRVAYGALEKEAVAQGVGRLVQGLKAIRGK